MNVLLVMLVDCKKDYLEDVPIVLSTNGENAYETKLEIKHIIGIDNVYYLCVHYID